MLEIIGGDHFLLNLRYIPLSNHKAFIGVHLPLVASMELRQGAKVVCKKDGYRIERDPCTEIVYTLALTGFPERKI